jgi:hypothetical protein
MGEKAIGTAVYGSIIKEQLGVNNIVGGRGSARDAGLALGKRADRLHRQVAIGGKT